MNIVGISTLIQKQHINIRILMTDNITKLQTGVLQNKNLYFSISMIVFGIIGWFSSFMLATEYIRTLQNPGYIPGCSVSAIVSCAPNMASWQGSLLGFSNTFIGVAGFMIPIVLGVILLTGYKMQRWMWISYKIGMGGAFAFVLWLAYQSIFSLNVLCPWCMVVWVAVIVLFFGALFRKPFLNSEIDNEESHSELHNWKFIFMSLTIISIAVIAQIQLDWVKDVMSMF